MWTPARRPRGTGGILILVSELGSHGGIQRFNRLLVESCAAHVASRGRSLSVVSLGDSSSPSWERMPAGVASSDAGGSRPRFVAAAFRHASRSRPATVIAGLASFAPLAWAVTRLGLADQYAVELYGAEVWRPLSAHRKLALRNAAMLVSITEATASMAADVNDLGPVPVRLLAPAVDDVWLAPTPPFVDSASGPRRTPARYGLLSVARLDATEQRKGIDDILRAMAGPALRDDEIEYVVVGDGTDRPRLEALAGQLGLSRRVHFVGSLDGDALQAEFRGCDVFVMPSTQEGFGIVFLEAMACRKPVVATRFGGVPEVVVDGETGLLVEPGDAAGLDRALRALLDDPGLRHRLGDAGRRRVESRFTAGHFRESLNAILHELDQAAEGGRRASGGPRPVRA